MSNSVAMEKKLHWRGPSSTFPLFIKIIIIFFSALYYSFRVPLNVSTAETYNDIKGNERESGKKAVE